MRRVRANQPLRSSAVLTLIGAATASAPSARAARMPSASPRSTRPVSSASSGRSPSPSVDSSASSRCSATHVPICRATPGSSGLGVDRHEGLALPERHHLGAEPRQRRGEEVPPRGAVPVDAQGETAQRAFSEEADVSIDVGLSDLDRLAARVRQRDRRRNGGRDPRFVGLGDLAVGPVELEPVAVERNVAAGHHHRRNPAPRRRQRERRRGHDPGVEHRKALGGDRRGAGAGDPRRARPPVATEENRRRPRSGRARGDARTP